jgi:hypothetical protein
MMSRVFIVFLLLVLPIYADSVALISADDMIKRSDYIAIIEYLGATSGDFRRPSAYPGEKGSTRFSRQSTVRVIDSVKGDLSGEIQIYYGSGRWDALFQNHQDYTKQPEGRYLVFLKGEPAFLTGVYGWVSTAQIDGTNIDWTEGQPRVRQMVPLEDILTRVRAKQKQ